MILADTSVWIDHLRAGDARLSSLLLERAVLIHPFIIQEITLGHLTHREKILDLLGDLPAAPLATHEEVLDFIVSERLDGAGIGVVDAHLLASARLARAGVWSKDKALCRAAERLRLSASFQA